MLQTGVICAGITQQVAKSLSTVKPTRAAVVTYLILANLDRACWISFCVESDVIDRISVLHAVVKFGNLLTWLPTYQSKQSPTSLKIKWPQNSLNGS